MQRLKVILIMVVAEIVVAAFSISYKLAADDGMDMKVLITYRYLFSSVLIFPVAFFVERNKRPKLTWTIIFQTFLCAFFGGPVAQNLYANSLVLTSATFTAAFTNLIPPFTFIVVVLFRLEKIEIGKTSGQAKVIGTLVGVGGAMILTFYKGHQLNIQSTHSNFLHRNQHMDGHVVSTHKSSAQHLLGSLLALAYSLSIALYFTLQGKLSANYPCHYSYTFLFSFIGFIQSLVYVIPTGKSWREWKLTYPTRLFSAIFQGICSLLGVYLFMKAVHLQGPLFVSNFNPLVLIFVAIAGFAVLDEKLYVGSVIGSVIVIAGLYLVLWGKSKETKNKSKLTPSGSSNDVNAVSKPIATTTPSPGRTSISALGEGEELPAREKRKEQETAEEV